MAKWVNAGLLQDIGQPGSRGFDGFFIVRDDDASINAYRNACPHTGAPLEWVPDEFLDMEKRHIQCSMHGALFRIQDGHCLHGPCIGQNLQALPLEIRNEALWVDISAVFNVGS
jgi:nitrite reductase/ring-hydroxylating ferredoxin subunit